MADVVPPAAEAGLSKNEQKRRAKEAEGEEGGEGGGGGGRRGEAEGGTDKGPQLEEDDLDPTKYFENR